MGQLIFQLIDLKQNLIFQKFEFKDQEFEKLKKDAMTRVEQYYDLKNQESNYK